MSIMDEMARPPAKTHAHPGVSLGDYQARVDAALAGCQRSDLVGRIWRRDHTVWKPGPAEIADRLGWLTVAGAMRQHVAELTAFAREVRDAGYRNVVLLGMGGSSLGPEVLRQAFGSAPGYPGLIVLDSTVPEWVRAVGDAVDPAHALFLVSSKSGTTTEPNALYAHFRGLVEQAIGKERAGRNFLAVTDPGSPLEKLGRERGFRRVFLNPPDIGGRYSVLTYFGLVPAALSGIDIPTLLDRADGMGEACAASIGLRDNPGAWLGVVMGALAHQGRDKVTLAASPAISGFGLWVEQLIAESTGKEGAGIVPVAGEPLAAPWHYGDDRLFVHLRLEGDDNAATDAALQALESAGQPVFRLDLRDRFDLGAEFFRWEFATAVAGAVLGIHPFDQPNVQAAKDMTERVLRQYQTSGQLPRTEAAASLAGLSAAARTGDYLAIMAYLRQTPEVDQASDALRQKVMERSRIATTFGYGPRFLHSTGQLHKGGPGSGLFLQLTADHQEDVPIPGRPYTFGVLADAQAAGDLQALQAAGRRVARVHLGPDAPAGIRALASGLA